MSKSLMLAIFMAGVVILNGQPTKYEEEVSDENILADSPGEYFFNKALLTWSQADAVCKKHGMRLVTVMNAAQDAYIHREIRKRKMNFAWIGLNDNAKEGNFVWLYNCPKYRHFNRGEPNGKRTENCVHMYSNARYPGWNDLNCNSKHGSVCHKVVPQAIDTCGAPRGYAFIRQALTWAQADATCKKHGMRLVTIYNKGQNALIHREIKKRGMTFAWIGLNDNAKEGNFVWLYSCPKYRNFNRGEPNGKRRENCVHMYSNAYGGLWNDLNCNSKHPAVCHKATGGACGGHVTHHASKTVVKHGGGSTVHHQTVTKTVTYEKVYYKRVPADEKKAADAKSNAKAE